MDEELSLHFLVQRQFFNASMENRGEAVDMDGYG